MLEGMEKGFGTSILLVWDMGCNLWQQPNIMHVIWKIASQGFLPSRRANIFVPPGFRHRQELQLIGEEGAKALTTRIQIRSFDLFTPLL